MTYMLLCTVPFCSRTNYKFSFQTPPVANWSKILVFWDRKKSDDFYLSFSDYCWLSNYFSSLFRQLDRFIVYEFMLPLTSTHATEESLIRLFQWTWMFLKYFQQFLKINQNRVSFKRKWDFKWILKTNQKLEGQVQAQECVLMENLSRKLEIVRSSMLKG